MKILIIRFSSIGDIVLTTPLIRIIRKTWPGAQIDFVIKKRFAPLIQYNPYLTKVYTYDPSDADSTLMAIGRRIRVEQYDIIADMHRNIRSKRLLLFSKAGTIVKFKKYIIPRLLLVHFKMDVYPQIVPVYLRYLNALNLKDDGLGLEIFIPDEMHRQVGANVADFPADYEKIIAIAPGASYATKRWPADRFRALVELLSKNNSFHFVLVGDQSDRTVCNKISAGLSNVTNAAGRLELLETAALLSRCDMLITNDTGLMHIATALKKPIVAIFGSTTEELGFFPDCSHAVVIENKTLKCRPCSHVGRNRCPHGHFRCMLDISPEVVQQAVHTMLNN